MKNIFVCLVLFFAVGTSWGAKAPRLGGAWQGTLRVGAVRLRLVLHLRRQPDGAWAGSLDSVDQGAMGIPISSIEFTGTVLRFASAAIHGSYRGTLSPGGNTISGVWTQNRSLPLNFHRMAKTAASAKPSNIGGAWQGEIVTPQVKLAVTYHFFSTALGLRATMDVPDQGAFGVPFSSVVRQGNRLTLVSAATGGKFTGAINPAQDGIDGAWTQNGNTFPLRLKRAALPARRPQAPRGALPYLQKQVRFENAAAGIRLAGTLTLPPGRGPFPGVILIAGSGPHDRDETIFGHKPFLVLADYLTRRGIAVLRYDKRGVGESQGSELTATTADFAGDAQAAFNYLRAQPEINPKEVGLIGHSEGGAIAPMVAARDPHVALIVLLAGSGVNGARLLVEQVRALARAAGLAPANINQSAKRERRLLTVDAGKLQGPRLDMALRRQLLADHAPPARIDAMLKTLELPWLRYMLRYDPAPTLAKVHCPVLALDGSLDLQVPARPNLAAIRNALVAGGNRHFEVKELPGLNHLFQPAHTGLVSEYARIPVTIAPGALATIYAWIQRQWAAGS